MKNSRHRFQRVILVIFLLIGSIVGGCVEEHSQMNGAFSQVMPIKNLNQDFVLSKLDIDGFGDKNSFVIVAENKSNHPIIFPKDYGLQWYSYMSNSWSEINNKAVYIPDEIVVLWPKGHPNKLYQRDIPFSPDLPDLKQPISLRLAVIGNIQLPDGSLGEEVGAYIDFTWEP